MYIKAHLFENMDLANEAISVINNGEGIPVNDQSLTTSYCQAQENNGNIFIVADEVTIQYLDTPTDLELIYNEEIWTILNH